MIDKGSSPSLPEEISDTIKITQVDLIIALNIGSGDNGNGKLGNVRNIDIFKPEKRIAERFRRTSVSTDNKWKDLRRKLPASRSIAQVGISNGKIGGIVDIIAVSKFQEAI